MDSTLISSHGDMAIANIAPANLETAPNFGSSEISGGQSTNLFDPEFLTDARDGRTLEEIIAVAAAWDGDRSLFFGWRDKLAGPLQVAYPLFLELLRGGKAVVATVLASEYFAARERLPSRSNLTYIALLLVARPRIKADRQSCSACAPVLIFAALQ